jgi:ribosomal protein S6--L-glutamate ligase
MVLDTLRFSLLVDAGEPGLFYKNQRLATPDAVVPRIGASITDFGCAVVRQFEQLGALVLNRAQGISDARDKLTSLQLLSARGIAVPATAFPRERTSVAAAIEQVGGVPVVIKLLEGSQGVGVILAESVSAAEATVQALQLGRQGVLIQKFVSESRGRDLRALVVGDRVVAAVSRLAHGDEFRSNVHRGASATRLELDPVLEQTALGAARALSLDVAGVDMVESDHGVQVFEVNASPGIEGIEAASGVDVAGAIVDQLERARARHRAPRAAPVLRN